MFDRIIAYLIWPFFLLVAYAPSWLLDILIAMATSIRMIFSRKEVNILYQNVENIFGLKRATVFSKMFLEQVFHSQIRINAETIRGILRPNLLRIDGLDSFREEMQRRENPSCGNIIISAHLGSWELIGLSFSQAASYQFNALAKPTKYPWFNICLEKLRKKMGTILVWTQIPALGKRMLEKLTSGQSLGFVADQKPKRRIGPIINFFGRQTEMVVGPSSMAIKIQCGIIGVFVLRKGPMHFQLCWENIVDARHGMQDEIALTQLMATCMEKYIRLYPEQWCWNYKRWRF